MKYLDIYPEDTANGPGVRVSFWPSGCAGLCEGCHNKESWDPNHGKDYTLETENKIIELLKKPYIKGLSLLGGDPLFPSNIPEITKLVKKVKQECPDKDIWLWTGYLFEDIRDLEIFKYVDICIDGPFILSQRDVTLAFRGSPNQRIIDVQKSLSKGEIIEKEGF